MRNPQTGETFLIAEHDTLRVRVLKKARNAVTPQPENLITVLHEGPSPQIPEDFSKAVSFCCKTCRQEIEAPLSAVGMQAQCPACGGSILVPSESEPGTLHGPVTTAPAPAPAVESTQNSFAAMPNAFKTAPAEIPPPAEEGPKHKANQTIRIDLAALGFDNAEGATASAAQKTLPSKRMLSFFCKNCRQEIEAPADMAGSATECPSCGVSFEVPFFSDPGTLHGSDLEQKKIDADTLKDMRGRTIRIEVPDDI